MNTILQINSISTKSKNKNKLKLNKEMLLLSLYVAGEVQWGDDTKKKLY